MLDTHVSTPITAALRPLYTFSEPNPVSCSEPCCVLDSREASESGKPFGSRNSTSSFVNSP